MRYFIDWRLTTDVNPGTRLNQSILPLLLLAIRIHWYVSFYSFSRITSTRWCTWHGRISDSEQQDINSARTDTQKQSRQHQLAGFCISNRLYNKWSSTIYVNTLLFIILHRKICGNTMPCDWAASRVWFTSVNESMECFETSARRTQMIWFDFRYPSANSAKAKVKLTFDSNLEMCREWSIHQLQHPTELGWCKHNTLIRWRARSFFLLHLNRTNEQIM